MKLRTELSIKPSNTPFSYESSIFSIGSCFAEQIGNKLKENKFKINSSPLGTVFNPVSILNSLKSISDSSLINDDLVCENQGVFFHYNFHSKFKNTNAKKLITQLKEDCKNHGHSFITSDTLIITFGTAFVYEYEGKIISNCHKQPQKLFNKRLLSVEEIIKAFQQEKHLFKHFKNIILTVSPVRHTKDGISENSLSKSILRVVCNELLSILPNASYFPSYEIMIDDLRDYRFYKEDMIHPNQQAEKHIFNKFIEAFTTIETQNILEAVKKINAGLNHRSFNPLSDEHKKFKSNLILQIDNLPSEIDFNKERAIIVNQT